MTAAQATADGVTGSMRRQRCAGDISGAFADGAILFPLLVALALALHFGSGGLPAYPAALQAILLGVVGLLHMQLARASWQSSETRPILLAMGGAALLTQNMLVVLIAGCALLALRKYCPALTSRLWRPRPRPEHSLKPTEDPP